MNGPRRLRWLAALLAAVVAGVALGAAAQRLGSVTSARAASPRSLTPIGDDGDWLAQDYTDSRGIAAVRAERGGLVASARLRGGDAHVSQGEVYTDLKYYVGIESGAVDLSRRTVRVVVDVPAAFVGQRSAPNGVQVFVKDSAFRAQYSTYRNVDAPGRVTVALSPSASGGQAAFTAPGFDPSRVRVIGVKFAIGGRSNDAFTGRVRVLGVNVSPALILPARPLSTVPVPRRVFSGGGGLTLHRDGFHVGGKRRFVTGGNFTPIEYGQSFGTMAWYPGGNGVSRHPNYIAASLAIFRKAGVHTLRIPLVADGRALLDDGGRVRGYDARFRADVRTLLRLAAAHDQRVELTLVDFLLGGRAERVDGVTVRGRPGVFTDSAIRRAFFDDFVRPFLREFGRNRALFGIDCVNEPEWLVSNREGGNWEDVDPATRAVQSIPRAALDAFLADCAKAVAQVAPRLTVTAGTSVRNLALTAQTGDYSAVHHYPYMGRLDSFAKALPTTRPWLLEELPTSDEEYAKSRRAGGPGDLGAYLTAARRLGSAGALLWSLNPGADDATVSLRRFDSRLRALRAWCRSNSETFCARR